MLGTPHNIYQLMEISEMHKVKSHYLLCEEDRDRVQGRIKFAECCGTKILVTKGLLMKLLTSLEYFPAMPLLLLRCSLYYSSPSHRF